MSLATLDKYLQRGITYTFFFIFFAVPFLFYTGNSELFEFNKMIATYAATVLITGFWVARCILTNKFIFEKTYLGLPILLFLISQAISTYFSIDQHISFWGYYSRSNGGLLSTLCYIILYFSYVSNIHTKDTRQHIKGLLVSAFILSIYAILEHFGYSISCLFVSGEFNAKCWVQDVELRVFATIGQPNWLAAWLVAILPLSWIVLENSINKILKTKLRGNFQKYLAVLLPFLIFAALLFTKSRSGFLAFLVIFGIYWIFILFKLKKWRTFLLLSIGYVSISTIFGTPWTPGIRSLLLEPSAKFFGLYLTDTASTIAPDISNSDTFRIRLIVWKGAIDTWKAFPFFGTGVETFAFSYYQFRPVEHNSTSEWDFLYNKAHNEYLNYLSTTGLVGLICYLSLIIVFLAKNLKFLSLKSKPEVYYLNIAILAGFISILITNSAGFSVVNTATLFFLFPAIFIVVNKKYKTDGAITGKISLRQIIFLTLITTLTTLAIYYTINIWRADFEYNRGSQLLTNGYPNLAIKPLEIALNLRKNEPLYYNKYSAAVADIALNLAQNNNLPKAVEIAENADMLQAKALSMSPRSTPILRDAHINYLNLSTVDQKYLNKSHEIIKYLADYSPTDPNVFLMLGSSYLRIGLKEDAIKAANRAIELKPDFNKGKEFLVELKAHD